MTAATSLRPGALPLSLARSQADRVEAILANHQRNGGTDMTVREVCRAYQHIWGVLMFPGQVEARLAALEAARRVLCNREHKRPCSVTRQTVKVYSVPMKQVEMI